MNYTCPYCGRPTTITSANKDVSWTSLSVGDNVYGNFGIESYAIACPNIECKKVYLKISLTKSIYGSGIDRVKGAIIQEWQILPESEAKVLPEYIPQAIQDDYYEACRIRNLSPKASATLSRRCLQGMIRDFYGIKKGRLIDEIKELKSLVAPDVWESIDVVRKVGNIGAHMEKDINIIVEVEPEEAQLLIGLIEQLIEDWYVIREQRRARSENLKNLAASKGTIVKGGNV